MTQYLPPNLLALFAARDPLQFLPPSDKLPHEKKRAPYLGVAGFLAGFEDPKDTPPPTRVETRDERKERKRKERQEQHAYKLEQDLALWDPASNPSSTSDPFRSLYVARVNFDSSESKMRREFEVYGPIKKICLINDSKSGKPRGYAFIEYEHERDMHSAYKHADGKKIDGRRVLVDVERGRTVKGWRPRRLGGGLGGTRKGGPDENTRFSGRDEFSAGNAERGGGGGGGGRDFRDEERGPGGGGGPGGGRMRERSRSRERERRRRSRSKERTRRSRSREPREARKRSRSRERRPRSRDRNPERADVEGPEAPEEGDVKEVRKTEKDKKRSRRSRSRDRDRRNRSRSRDRKRSRRSRSKERKFSKIKAEEGGPGLLALGGYKSQKEADAENGQPANGDEAADTAYAVDEYGNIRVKEEKVDAYAGYGGPGGAGYGVGDGDGATAGGPMVVEGGGPTDGGDIEEGEEVGP